MVAGRVFRSQNSALLSDMNTQTTKQMYILAFIMGGVWGTLSYLVALVGLILALTVSMYWIPLNEWLYGAVGFVGWLLGAWLEIKLASK